MWIKANNKLINLDRVQCISDTTADQVFLGICNKDDRQPLIDAIARALGNNMKVFDLQEWLDHRHQDKEA